MWSPCHARPARTLWLQPSPCKKNLLLLGWCSEQVSGIYFHARFTYFLWLLWLLLNEVGKGPRPRPPRLQGAPSSPGAAKGAAASSRGPACPFPLRPCPAARTAAPAPSLRRPLPPPAAMLASRGPALCTALRRAAPGGLASFHCSAGRRRNARVAVVSNGAGGPGGRGPGQRGSSSGEGLFTASIHTQPGAAGRAPLQRGSLRWRGRWWRWEGLGWPGA